MPYLQFPTKKEREKARDIQFDLAEENGNEVQGLIAVINDPNFGFVDFYSEDPYLEAFDKAGIEYHMVPRERITAPYADHLRKNYPQFSGEL